jgi:hypothetical protein
VTGRLDGVTRSSAVALAIARERNLYTVLRGGGPKASALGIGFQAWYLGQIGESPDGYQHSRYATLWAYSRLYPVCSLMRLRLGRSAGG